MFKRLLCLTAALSLAYIVTVSANTVTVDVVSGAANTVRVSGMISGFGAGERLMITVLNPNASIDGEVSEAVAYIGNTLTVSGGTFEYTFSVDPATADTGFYTIRITGRNVLLEPTVHLAGVGAVNNALRDIRAAGTARDMVYELNSWSEVLGLNQGANLVYYEMFQNFSEPNQHRVGEMLIARRVAMVTAANVLTEFNQAVSVTAINSAANAAAVRTLLEDAAGRVLGLDMERLYETVLTTESSRANFSAAFVSGNFASAQAFRDAAEDAVVTGALRGLRVWLTMGETLVLLHNELDNFVLDMSPAALARFTEDERIEIWKYLTDNSHNITGSAALRAMFDRVTARIIASRPPVNVPRPPQGGGLGGGGGFASISAIPYRDYPEIYVPGYDEVFSDLGAFSWAAGSIEALYEIGLVQGFGDGAFRPGLNVTREQFVALLVRAFDFALSDEDLAFRDVAADGWYYRYIVTGYNRGIIRGRDENYFGAGENITRQEMAVMIHRIIENEGIELAGTARIDGFADIDEVDEFALESIETMRSNGIINGIGGGLFAPRNFANRAEAAHIIYTVLRIRR